MYHCSETAREKGPRNSESSDGYACASDKFAHYGVENLLRMQLIRINIVHTKHENSHTKKDLRSIPNCSRISFAWIITSKPLSVFDGVLPNEPKSILWFVFINEPGCVWGLHITLSNEHMANQIRRTNYNVARKKRLNVAGLTEMHGELINPIIGHK